MTKFNKLLTSKIVSIIIAGVFLVNNIAYAIDLPNKSHLRIPVGEEETRRRMEELYELHQKSMDEVIEKGQFRAISEFEQVDKEFRDSIEASGASETIRELEDVLKNNDGQIQFIFVKSEDELPEFQGKRVIAHPGSRSITVYIVTQLTPEKYFSNKANRRKTIAIIYREIILRSTRARERFEDMKTAGELSGDDLDIAMKELTKDADDIRDEISVNGDIEDGHLRNIFANLEFDKEIAKEFRGYTLISMPGVERFKKISARELKQLKKWERQAVTVSGWRKGDISISDLTVYGDILLRSSIYGYREDPRVINFSKRRTKAPTIILTYDDEKIEFRVIDGMKRLAAALLRGDEKIEAYIGIIKKRLGSPSPVFNLLSDGAPRTKKEIAKALNRAVSTIEPDLYFLRDCGLLDIKKRGRENTYAIKPELAQNLSLLAGIQEILEKEFYEGVIVKKRMDPKEKGRIIRQIRAKLSDMHYFSSVYWTGRGRFDKLEDLAVYIDKEFSELEATILTLPESMRRQVNESEIIKQSKALLDQLQELGWSKEPLLIDYGAARDLGVRLAQVKWDVEARESHSAFLWWKRYGNLWTSAYELLRMRYSMPLVHTAYTGVFAEIYKGLFFPLRLATEEMQALEPFDHDKQLAIQEEVKAGVDNVFVYAPVRGAVQMLIRERDVSEETRKELYRLLEGIVARTLIGSRNSMRDDVGSALQEMVLSGNPLSDWLKTENVMNALEQVLDNPGELIPYTIDEEEIGQGLTRIIVRPNLESSNVIFLKYWNKAENKYKFVLIDGGSPQFVDALKDRVFSDIGISDPAEQIELIIITHCDPDHLGALKIAEEYNIPFRADEYLFMAAWDRGLPRTSLHHAFTSGLTHIVRGFQEPDRETLKLFDPYPTKQAEVLLNGHFPDFLGDQIIGETSWGVFRLEGFGHSYESILLMLWPKQINRICVQEEGSPDVRLPPYVIIDVNGKSTAIPFNWNKGDESRIPLEFRVQGVRAMRVWERMRERPDVIISGDMGVDVRTLSPEERNMIGSYLQMTGQVPDIEPIFGRSAHRWLRSFPETMLIPSHGEPSKNPAKTKTFQPDKTKPAVIVSGAGELAADHIIKALVKDGFSVVATASDPSKAGQLSSVLGIPVLPVGQESTDVTRYLEENVLTLVGKQVAEGSSLVIINAHSDHKLARALAELSVRHNGYLIHLGSVESYKADERGINLTVSEESTDPYIRELDIRERAIKGVDRVMSFPHVFLRLPYLLGPEDDLLGGVYSGIPRLRQWVREAPPEKFIPLLSAPIFLGLPQQFITAETLTYVVKGLIAARYEPMLWRNTFYAPEGKPVDLLQLMLSWRSSTEEEQLQDPSFSQELPPRETRMLEVMMEGRYLPHLMSPHTTAERLQFLLRRAQQFLDLGIDIIPPDILDRNILPASQHEEDVALTAGKFRKPKHGDIHEVIENGLPQDFKNYRDLPLEDREALKARYRDPDGQLVIPIEGLILGAGLLGHIGLGHYYDEPVIYIDAIFEEERREDIKKHESDEIGKWEEKRRELRLSHEEMRTWIRENSNKEGTGLAQKLAREWHDAAHSIDHIYDDLDVRLLLQMGRVNRIGAKIYEAAKSNFSEYKEIIKKRTGIELEAIEDVFFQVDEKRVRLAYARGDVAGFFLDFAETLNDDELASILAHEFTHIQLRKQELKNIEREMTMHPERHTAMPILRRPLQFSDAFPEAREIEARVAQAEEKLADESEAFLTAHAKFDPAAVKTAYEKVISFSDEKDLLAEQLMHTHFGEWILSFPAIALQEDPRYRDHPPDEKRLTALAQHIQKYERYSIEEIYAEEKDVVLTASDRIRRWLLPHRDDTRDIANKMNLKRGQKLLMFGTTASGLVAELANRGIQVVLVELDEETGLREIQKAKAKGTAIEPILLSAINADSVDHAVLEAAGAPKEYDVVIAFDLFIDVIGDRHFIIHRALELLSDGGTVWLPTEGIVGTDRFKVEDTLRDVCEVLGYEFNPGMGEIKTLASTIGVNKPYVVAKTHSVQGDDSGQMVPNAVGSTNEISQLKTRISHMFKRLEELLSQPSLAYRDLADGSEIHGLLQNAQGLGFQLEALTGVALFEDGLGARYKSLLRQWEYRTIESIVNLARERITGRRVTIDAVEALGIGRYDAMTALQSMKDGGELIKDGDGFVWFASDGDGEPSMTLDIMANLRQPGLRLLDIGTFTGAFPVAVARMNPDAEKLVGIEQGLEEDRVLQEGEIEIELRKGSTLDRNWKELVESQYYDVVTVVYPDRDNAADLTSLFGFAAWAVKPGGMIYVVADSVDFAEQTKFHMQRGLFINAEIISLPEEWPRSEQISADSPRENHRIIAGIRPDSRQIQSTQDDLIVLPADYTTLRKRILQENVKYFVYSYDSTTGLPYNYIDIEEGDVKRRMTRWISPTDIGLYINVLVKIAKGDLAVSDLITTDEAMRRLTLLMHTLGSVKKSNGFFYYYDIAEEVSVSDLYSRLVSTVDNGNLAASLAVMVGAFRNGSPEQQKLESIANDIVNGMDWDVLYDPGKKMLIGGYYTDVTGDTKEDLKYRVDKKYNEGRLAVMMAILSGKVPQDAWFGLEASYGFHPLPDGTTVSMPKPWNAAAFQAWLPLLFFDESKLSPEDYAVAHKHFLIAQRDFSIANGLNGALLSSAYGPDGKYREYGVLHLAEGDAVAGVGTPHATGLAFLVEPDVSLELFRMLDEKFPHLRGPFGYYESVDSSGRFSTRMTSLAQGILILSVAGGSSKYMQEYLEINNKLSTVEHMYSATSFTLPSDVKVYVLTDKHEGLKDSLESAVTRLSDNVGRVFIGDIGEIDKEDDMLAREVSGKTDIVVTVLPIGAMLFETEPVEISSEYEDLKDKVESLFATQSILDGVKAILKDDGIFILITYFSSDEMDRLVETLRVKGFNNVSIAEVPDNFPGSIWLDRLRGMEDLKMVIASNEESGIFKRVEEGGLVVVEVGAGHGEFGEQFLDYIETGKLEVSLRNAELDANTVQPVQDGLIVLPADYTEIRPAVEKLIKEGRGLIAVEPVAVGPVETCYIDWGGTLSNLEGEERTGVLKFFKEEYGLDVYILTSGADPRKVCAILENEGSLDYINSVIFARKSIWRTASSRSAELYPDKIVYISEGKTGYINRLDSKILLIDDDGSNFSILPGKAIRVGILGKTKKDLVTIFGTARDPCELAEYYIPTLGDIDSLRKLKEALEAAN